MIRMYIDMVRRSWWIVALTTLAAFTLALLSGYNADPQYRTSTRFVVSPTPSIEENRDIVDTVDSQQKLMATYAEVLNSGTIWAQAARTLGVSLEDIEKYDRKTVVLPEASVLETTVVGPDPEMTALLANQLGQEGIQYIKGLYQVYDINLLDPAEPPSDPFAPRIIQSAAVAAVVGFVIGVVLAILREQVITALVGYRQAPVVVAR